MVEDHGDRGREQGQDAFDAHDCSGAPSGAGVDGGAPPAPSPSAGLSLSASTVTTTGTGTYTTRSSISACQGRVQASTAARTTSATATARMTAAREVNSHQAVSKPVRSRR